MVLVRDLAAVWRMPEPRARKHAILSDTRAAGGRPLAEARPRPLSLLPPGSSQRSHRAHIPTLETDSAQHLRRHLYLYTTPNPMTIENTEPIPVPPPVTDTPATIEPTPAATTAAVVSEPEPTPAATASEPTLAPVAEAAAKSEGAFPD